MAETDTVRKHRRLSFSLSWIVFVGAVFGAVVCAATPPPAPPFENDDWEVRVDHKAATGLTLGKYRIRFEETPLQDVIRHAGGSIQHQGDAADSIYWLCFCKPDGFDVGNSLEWSVTNGSINAISAGQVTSC